MLSPFEILGSCPERFVCFVVVAFCLFAFLLGSGRELRLGQGWSYFFVFAHAVRRVCVFTLPQLGQII